VRRCCATLAATIVGRSNVQRPLRLLGLLVAVTAASLVHMSGGEFVVEVVGTPPDRNVIVIVTDDQVYESAVGPHSVMRNLNADPYGSWVEFPNAFVNAAICCPSRAAILSGRTSTHTGVLGNGMGARFDATRTLAVWLKRQGYRTALHGKYLNGWPFPGAQDPPPGWDEFATGGRSDRLTERALAFIRSSPDPYFLVMAYTTPHQPARELTEPRYLDADVPVVPDPPNFDEADVSDKPSWVRDLPELSPEDVAFIRAERLWSQRALLAVDDGIQRVMDEIAARDELDRTLVIVTSDNGFSFGSHRHVRKFCVYEECSHVPMFVRHPAVPEGRTEPRLVTNLDIAPTVADFVDVKPELTPDGRSLLPLLTDQSIEWRDAVLLEKRTGQPSQRYWAIRTDRWKYVEYDNGDRELYDLDADPYELDNLAGDATYEATRADLTARLVELRG
jgi:arylsulfatase A-like enzyme